MLQNKMLNRVIENKKIQFKHCAESATVSSVILIVNRFRTNRRYNRRIVPGFHVQQLCQTQSALDNSVFLTKSDDISLPEQIYLYIDMTLLGLYQTNRECI